MKRSIQLCLAALTALIIWSCQPKSVMVVSIPEIGAQSLMQNGDFKSDTLLPVRIKKLQYFDLELRAVLTSSSNSTVATYKYLEACCPCDSTVSTSSYSIIRASRGDVCCPCPSAQFKIGGGVSLVSLKDWKAEVTLLVNEKPTRVESSFDKNIQVFSFKGIPDGDYKMTMKGEFTSDPITVNVNLQGGKLSYKP